MFDGVKLLCLVRKEPGFESCLHPLIVRDGKFLKIANKDFSCPSCGHKSEKLTPFFLRLAELQKATKLLQDTGFYLKNYKPAFECCHEDGFETLDYILNKNDWGNWNMQIASIIISGIEQETRIAIWEDHFYKARPFVYPCDWELTFGSVLRRKAMYAFDHEFKNLSRLKDLIRNIRKYNEAWVGLLSSGVAAAPVDLTDPLATSLNNVKNLAELFEETYE